MMVSAKFEAVTVDYGYRGPSLIVGCSKIEFVAEAGLVTFLRGTNGSGKSSFFRALLNAAPLIGGHATILHNGSAISEPERIAVRELASRYEISYLPQSPSDALPAGMTLSTANQLWEKIHPTDPAEEWSDLKAFFEQLKHKDKESISGGQAQIISLYFAARRQADIYLLDEPSAYVSSENRSRITDSIRQLINKGCIVIVASHDDELLNDFQAQEKRIVTLA